MIQNYSFEDTLMRFTFSWRSRIVLAAAMLVGSASMARAEGFIWWCYNGDCCEMDGSRVTTNCDYGCGLPNGEQNAISIVLACPT